MCLHAGSGQHTCLTRGTPRSNLEMWIRIRTDHLCGVGITRVQRQYSNNYEIWLMPPASPNAHLTQSQKGDIEVLTTDYQAQSLSTIVRYMRIYASATSLRVMR